MFEEAADTLHGGSPSQVVLVDSVDRQSMPLVVERLRSLEDLLYLGPHEMGIGQDYQQSMVHLRETVGTHEMSNSDTGR